MKFAGFQAVSGAEVSDVQVESRLDTVYGFSIVGTEAVINEVLDAAGFRSGFEPGLSSVQESLFAGHIDALTAIESARDATTTDSGPVHRHIVRGRAGDGVVLRVEAFNT